MVGLFCSAVLLEDSKSIPVVEICFYVFAAVSSSTAI